MQLTNPPSGDVGGPLDKHQQQRDGRDENREPQFNTRIHYKISAGPPPPPAHYTPDSKKLENKFPPAHWSEDEQHWNVNNHLRGPARNGSRRRPAKIKDWT